MIQKTEYSTDDAKEREYRIQRMEKQLIENQFIKQTYPKKYDYTHSKNNYSVPINQLDYKSFYQSYLPLEQQQQMRSQNLQFSSNKTSSFKLSYDNNDKDTTPNKKQQQLQYRDILQKQVEEKQNLLKQQKTKHECTDIFTNNQYSTPNNKKSSLSKAEYQNYLQLQIQEKQSSNKIFITPIKNQQKVEEQNKEKDKDKDKNAKESTEFQIIQKQLKQYQEEKQQKDRKLLLQQKFEESTSIYEKNKDKSFSPEYHNKKKNLVQEDEDEKARTQQQKSVVSKILTEQIQEKQKKRDEEKKQQETEDKLAEERWKNEVQTMKEEKKREEELKKEQQGKIQQENIRMHQMKLKQQQGRNRSKSNTLQQSKIEEEFKEELEMIQQEIEEEQQSIEQIEQQEEIQFQQQQQQQQEQLNIKPNQVLSYVDQYNLELDKIKQQMISQQQQLERQIHAAFNLAQIGLLEGKNKIEKELILEKNKNNKHFNEDYAMALLNKNQSKYEYELPFLFNQKIQQDQIYRDNLLDKVQLNTQSKLIPLSTQHNKNMSTHLATPQQRQIQARSKSISQHSKQNYHQQLIDFKKSKQNDALSQLLQEYHE
ncbi:unnamed protein product (macronuclear) [Paramecium tetraurelia]|uniref:Uncharacterized protein n=1 Tax=Paramecium tetraurelia TaxID=5888 RepID=A0DT71_PARTE|nr:uncharacterized protein GSPATT00019931001 [Paramecium tetraurelia]CAK86238.1 unnamed protein product [Paramecium tetraurelia]|eukprot:XP_001453635.1 hypothetical protein (macronuclear) [Paramecium tetraurelia strain d4-2]